MHSFGHLKVDLLWDGESVNFHETNVTIEIDLTADFEIDGLTLIRVESDQDRADGRIQYPVVAYHCDESNVKQVPGPVLAQGQSMQMCVELDPTVINEFVFVVNILSIDLNQEKLDLSVTRKNIIDEAIPNALTSKLCQGGICNIKTQLDSSWFSDPVPGEIEATGTAILAFGSLSSGLRQRFLRVPIVFRQRRHAYSSEIDYELQGSEIDRELQQGDDGDSLLSSFILSTSLKISPDDKTQPLVYIAILVALFSCCGCCCWLTKRKFVPLSEEGESKNVPESDNTTSNDEDDSSPYWA
jgi:hypothetical protein